MTSDRKVLRDDQWERIAHLLPGKKGDCGVTAKDNRLFIEAVLWVIRTGAPWRDVTRIYGIDWHRVYVRYNRWSHKGVWQNIFKSIATDPDLEYLMIDSSIVRVHQHGASKKCSQGKQAQGHSRGGLSTKIHATVDSLGNPVRLLITEGQTSDHKKAGELIAGFQAQFVIGDKGYDSDDFVSTITDSGAKSVVPPRSNRKEMREYDKDLYKERNLVERFFQKLKNYRRIATRFERMAVHYLSMLALVSTVIWLA